MPLHTESKSSVEESVSYSHVQLYVDRVEDLSVYKALENQLNTFSNKVQNEDLPRLEQKKKLWQTLVMPETSSSFTTERTFCPQNRDVVQQLLSGFGFRVTGARYDDDDDTETCSTRSVLVTSRDPAGVQILVTAAADAAKPTGESTSDKPLTTAGIFNADKVRRFMDAHRGRQGVGVLAFAVENVEIIKERYEQRHPSLVDSYEEIPGGHKVLEVFACYQRHDDDGETSEQVADCGTILRFVQFSSESSSSLSTNHDSTAPSCTMLGLTPVDAVFEESSMSAYCDHWVSNVFDRTEFLETLEDTLGFTPKVDFNAGVVAAGEAQIESTVTGNTSTNVTADKEAALRDQSQVYLPINNALSSVGHVHGFLQEVGQGVQHVASRVENLVEFVQHGNEYREITGEGFSFLRIPRSYYGILTLQQLVEGIFGDGSDAVSEDCAVSIVKCLENAALLTKDGALDLDLDHETVDGILDKSLSGPSRDEFLSKRSGVIDVLLRSRYRNLYSLLQENVSSETYLGIVRNQILVDIQGDDLLYQIFTANILQRNAGEEAPFFEFIQRVCSECVIKPGCGGFGIRNFLTLFLSIEVSKAMQEVTDAKDGGDAERQQYAQTMVDFFTEQLNESNPILTDISEAMTEEGHCQVKMTDLMAQERLDEAATWKAKMKAAAERKRIGNESLMECSARYNKLMKSIREARIAVLREA